MFWLKNKIPLRFQFIYTALFIIYFVVFGGFKLTLEVFFFISVIGIMVSSIQYSYLYFVEIGLMKLGFSNKRTIYLLSFITLYILNICCMLLFTPVGWNGIRSYIYFYGFFGVSSLVFMFLLVTPLFKFLLKK
jgi:hypothetical protein